MVSRLTMTAATRATAPFGGTATAKHAPTTAPASASHRPLPRRVVTTVADRTCSGCSVALYEGSNGLMTCATKGCPGNLGLPPRHDESDAIGKNPAEGFASIWTATTGERWYCHGDDDESPTCYEATPQAVIRPAESQCDRPLCSQDDDRCTAAVLGSGPCPHTVQSPGSTDGA